MALPNEILDKIMNMHWSGLYKTNVIDVLDMTAFRLGKMISFLNKHFYPNNSSEYDKLILKYLLDYNKELNNLHSNKGLYLFCSNYNPIKRSLKSAFDKNYIQNCFKDIDPRIVNIAIFTCLNGISYMTYQIRARFIQMQKFIPETLV